MSAIAFQLRQVHDAAERQRVDTRSVELMTDFANRLGGRKTLDRKTCCDIERAAELGALVELGRDHVKIGPERSDDIAALGRLEAIARKVVAKLGLPA